MDWLLEIIRWTNFNVLFPTHSPTPSQVELNPCIKVILQGASWWDSIVSKGAWSKSLTTGVPATESTSCSLTSIHVLHHTCFHTYTQVNENKIRLYCKSSGSSCLDEQCLMELSWTQSSNQKKIPLLYSNNIYVVFLILTQKRCLLLERVGFI